MHSSMPFAIVVLMLIANASPLPDGKRWSDEIVTGRSIVRAEHGMVASSQPLASQVGLDVLKRGGNAVDAAIAMAAMLNVTEPMMTGIGGDAFMLVHWSKTKELKGLNASGRAPRALNLDYFKKKGIKSMPAEGMEPITVPGAFDGWVTLLEKYGSMKLADLLAPAIEYAENGFPVMEKTAADWESEVAKAQKDSCRSDKLSCGRTSAARGRNLSPEKSRAHSSRCLRAAGATRFTKARLPAQ